jgi:predicted oxidoreductase
MVSRTKLSPTGPELSRIVYGSWRLLEDQPTAQDVNRRLGHCLDAGITTIDTAEIYGGYRVEAMLGEALALTPGLRSKLEIVTKSGIYIPHASAPKRRVAFYDASAAQLTKSVEESLRLLRTDRMELFLVHRPDWLTSVDDTADGLNRLLKSGKILNAGVSNYSHTQFAALSDRMDQPLVTNQVEFSLLHMAPLFDGTFDQCQARRIRPMAWSPLAGGRLFDASNEAAARIAKEAALIAPKYGNATIEQLAYAWVLSHPAKPLALLGTNKLDRIKSGAQADSIVLEREDWFALWVAAQGHGIP